MIVCHLLLKSQEIKYFVYAKSSRKKTDEYVLKQEYLQGCNSGQEQDFHVNILVPTVPPNLDTACDIIKIKYFIRVSKKNN